ncbi:MAG: hypothetical protein U9Q63_04420, partial [Patescibacteria group bacterium]|nr:hypothetical protein [Patescibacteria group bacterium]
METKGVLVLKTSGGKTSTIGPLTMSLGKELFGMKGIFVAKQGQGTEAFNVQRMIFGDDLYRFKLGKENGNSVELAKQLEKLKESDFIVLEIDDIAFTMDRARDFSNLEEMFVAKEILTEMMKKSSFSIDEIPELLGGRNEWVQSFGEGLIEATDGQIDLTLAFAEVLKEIDVFIDGDFISERLNLSDEYFEGYTKALDGTEIEDLHFTEKGARKIANQMAETDQFKSLNGEDIYKIFEADAKNNKEVLEAYKAQNLEETKRVLELTDLMNKTATMLASEFGSDSFWVEGKGAAVGKEGNVQLSQKDSNLMLALAREMVTAHVNNDMADYTKIKVNGQTIKTNIFDVLNMIDRVSSGESIIAGMTATPEDVFNILEAAGFKSGDISLESMEAIFGESGRLNDENVIGLGENSTARDGFDKFVEFLRSGKLSKSKKGVENKKNNHILALMGTMTIEDAARLALEKYRLLENGIDEVILTGPDGENYRAYFDDNGKVRCDEKVTEAYTNKNLSE